jgi:outer membrane protein TolC
MQLGKTFMTDLQLKQVSEKTDQKLFYFTQILALLIISTVLLMTLTGCQEKATAEGLEQDAKVAAAPQPAASTAPAVATTASKTETSVSSTSASPDPRTQGQAAQDLDLTVTDPIEYMEQQNEAPSVPSEQSTVGGGGQTDIPSSPVITIRPLPESNVSLSQALSDSMGKNLEIQVKVIDVEIKNDINRQAIGAFNPVFKLDGRFENLDRPQNTQDFVSTGGNALILTRSPRIFNEDNYRFKASLEGKLPIGTEYEFFSEYDIIENTLSKTSPLSLFTPEQQNFTGVRLTQPLLRNFGTNVNMAEIRVARKDKRISKLELKDTMLSNVAQTLIAYYDMVYLVQDFRLKQEEFDLARTLTEKRREALERGQISSRELSRAESAMAEVTEELIISRNKVIERQTQFIALTSDAPANMPLSIIIPSTTLPVPEYDLDLNSLLAEAFTHRPRYNIAKRTVEREQIKLVYASNQIWPQLDLKATAGYNGLDSHFTGSYAKAFGENQGEQWSVGAVFSVPIGNDIAIGKRNEAKRMKEQALLNMRNAELQTSLQVQQLVTIIESNYDRLDAMRSFRSNANRALGTEEERLEKGQTTELEIMKFRRDLNKAKVRETAALADLNKAYVKLYETTGTLLERNNIAITQ